MNRLRPQSRWADPYGSNAPQGRWSVPSWWPRAHDLAAMVGLAVPDRPSVSGSWAPWSDRTTRSAEAESLTVLAARLSQLVA